MKPAATKKHSLSNNKDAPFTTAEKVKAFVIVLSLPWIFWAPMLLLGAWLRTFPAPPRPWLGFWLTLFTISVGYVLGLFLLLDRPRILRERMSKFRPDKETSDQEEKRFFAIGAPISVAGIVYISWDAVGQEENFPYLWNLIGSIMFLASLLAIAVVFRVNSFASKIVYKQQKQQLITSGPYRIVRHPMYLAMIFFLIGLPLCMGTFYGIIPMILMVILIAWRTFHEEKFLEQTFQDDYRAYRRRVKYRMVPFLF